MPEDLTGHAAKKINKHFFLGLPVRYQPTFIKQQKGRQPEQTRIKPAPAVDKLNDLSQGILPGKRAIEIKKRQLPCVLSCHAIKDLSV